MSLVTSGYDVAAEAETPAKARNAEAERDKATVDEITFFEILIHALKSSLLFLGLKGFTPFPRQPPFL